MICVEEIKDQHNIYILFCQDKSRGNVNFSSSLKDHFDALETIPGTGKSHL